MLMYFPPPNSDAPEATQLWTQLKLTQQWPICFYSPACVPGRDSAAFPASAVGGMEELEEEEAKERKEEEEGVKKKNWRLSTQAQRRDPLGGGASIRKPFLYIFKKGIKYKLGNSDKGA